MVGGDGRRGDGGEGGLVGGERGLQVGGERCRRPQSAAFALYQAALHQLVVELLPFDRTRRAAPLLQRAEVGHRQVKVEGQQRGATWRQRATPGDRQ